MKTALYTVEALSLFCPECKSTFVNTLPRSPVLSQYVYTIDDDSIPNAGDVMNCENCGANSKCPSIVRKLETFQQGHVNKKYPGVAAPGYTMCNQPCKIT